jgi:hypothetical protein
VLTVGILFCVSFATAVAGGAVGYRGGGYTGEFWAKPLDEKLDHLHIHRFHWWVLSFAQLLGLVVLTAGVTGLTAVLADSGEQVTAFVAGGMFLVALIAWTTALIAQTTTLPVAATQRAETGHTPAWIQAFWSFGYLAEGTWVILANLAYAVFGAAMLASGVVASWAGWVGIGVGVGIPVSVVAARYGFPELTQVVPLIWGVALIIGS